MGWPTEDSISPSGGHMKWWYKHSRPLPASRNNPLFVFYFHDILSFPMFLPPQFLCLLCWFIMLHFYILEASELGSPFLFTYCLKGLSSDLMTSQSTYVLKTLKLMFYSGPFPQLYARTLSCKLGGPRGLSNIIWPKHSSYFLPTYTYLLLFQASPSQ